MGRENKIVTGNVGGKRVARGTTGSSFGSSYSNSKLLKSSTFDYGIVTAVLTDQSIYYTPVENNISFNQPGEAIPLYPNSQQKPAIGMIVPLLRAPGYNVTSPTQNYSKFTYYLEPIGVSGTVNGNVVDIGTGNTGKSSLPVAVKLTKEQVMANAIEIKNYLKTKGLTKEQAAGVLGNMFKENSQFNPTESGWDSNGHYAFGLIMWNGAYTKDTNGNDTPDNFSAYGNTIQSQMDALFNPKINPNTKNFLTDIKNEPNKTADYYAYLFAKNVEKCAACTEGYDVFIKGKTINWPKEDGTPRQITVNPGERGKEALNFLQKFNDPNDPLAW